MLRNIHDPGKFFDQGNTGKNKHGTHNYRPDNSPKQNPVLIFRLYFKEAKNHDKHKKIINA